MDATPDPADDRGPFGPSLFQDPQVRALSRVGVVDVGSNSIRMVVFDGAARSPAYFFNEKVMAGLGSGLAVDNRLNPKGRERALAALARFALLAKGMGIEQLSVVATAAVREAEDGPAFAAEVLERTGLRLHVIDGAEEARLSAQGVLLGWPEADGLVCDIGGNSVEFAILKDGRVGKRVSTQIGPFRLQQVPAGARRKHIRDVLIQAREAVGKSHERIYLVGGSWRAFARLDMERKSYPLTVLHEYRMSRDSVQETVEWLKGADLALLRARTGLSSDRIDLVPLASEVLDQISRLFRPKEMDISSYGIREGLLYEQMPDVLRRRDPLIEACRYAEITSARIPGFGRRLFDFLMPLYKGAKPDQLRIIKAACLLHDTTWRAHPDYRAEVCFDNATRANLGGLNHPERVFLGLALLHRYKNSRAGTRLEPLLRLLTDAQIQQAEVLGKAMRFGAMFSVQAPQEAGSLRWFPKRQRIELWLTPELESLYGEVAEARFRSLATALKAEMAVKLAPRAE